MSYTYQGQIGDNTMTTQFGSCTVTLEAGTSVLDLAFLPTSFSTPAELTAFLQLSLISPTQYDQILSNLGYSPSEADAAIESKELTGELILAQFDLL